MIEGKYVFGSVAVGTLGTIQVIAFALGIDGQVLSMTTAGITAIITFLLGINITSPAQKVAVRETVTAILNNKPPTNP